MGHLKITVTIEHNGYKSTSMGAAYAEPPFLASILAAEVARVASGLENGLQEEYGDVRVPEHDHDWFPFQRGVWHCDVPFCRKTRYET